MKQAQFRRAAQSSGFRPIQVSGAEISRMREEGNRVIQGMRAAREADIRNRENVLRETKENQRAEEASRERNFQIQTQNQQRELVGLQQEAQARRQQFEVDQRAQAEIFKEVAQFSETAGKTYAQYVEAKDERDFNAAYQTFLENPDANKFYKGIISEAFQDEAEELRQQSLDDAEKVGGDKLGIAKQRNYNNRVERELKKSIIAYAAKNDFNRLRASYINEKEEAKGSSLTSEERSGYTAEFTELFIKKGSEASGVRLTPGSLRTTLEFIQNSNQKYLSSEREKSLALERQYSIDQETKIIDQNPDEFATNIIPSFQAIARAYGGDDRYVKAHDWLQARATMQRADGTFNLTLDQIANITLPSDKKPYALARPGRFAEIKRARQRADTTFRQQQITSDNLSFKEDEARILKMLTEDNSQANADESIEYFRERYGKVPSSIQQFANSYTIEAVTKAEEIQRIEAIPYGFIQLKDVDQLAYLDPQAGRELDRRYQAQERKYKQGIFKDQSDSFKTIANGVTSFGSQKPNTPASLFLQQQMRAEYRRRVDQAEAGGADFNTAANTIAQQLSSEVSAGARDPNSKWYRKASKPGGAADFPNLNTGAVLAVEQAQRNFNAIIKKVADQGIEATLNEAGSIITAEEAPAIVQKYGKPGFVIPADVIAFASLTKGLDPFTIINRQFRALGIPELDPPQITQDINNEVSPEFRRELYNPNNGSRQKIRVLEQSSVRQTNNVNRFQRPAVMRNSFKRSFTGAIIYQDNPDQYVETGRAFQALGFQVAEHPDFGGTAPVHAGNSYHGYGEAFDVTHQTGDYNTSIEKTRQLKEAVRSMNLFEEIIGPGDGDPDHETHLHLGGLIRPITPKDIEQLNSLFK